MAEWVQVGKAAEIRSGEREVFDLGYGLFVAVFNVSGTYYAIEDVCSHDDGPVGEGELEGYAVICPRHGARFDIRTGKALSMPAVTDIPWYPVKIEDGYILIDIGET